jgi:twitching motility two-component system response regulator PilG
MSETFEFSVTEQSDTEAKHTKTISARAVEDCIAPDAEQSRDEERKERRSRRRALISAPVLVRNVQATEGPAEDISTTLDVSRSGLLFVSRQTKYFRGMEVKVTFPYSKSPVAVQAEQEGRVVRVSAMADGRFSVAIALGSEDVAHAKKSHKTNVTYTREAGSKKPLVVAVDADQAIRESLSAYLGNEGYEVIAVSSAAEAHEVLSTLTPNLLISEIEGADLPGYDLCAHVKATPRLQTVPVMLLTKSAYPSDYANAHSLGAVVCMAKPYRQERLGHVVRLLAPTPEAMQATGPARPADLQRRTDSHAKQPPPKKKSRFRLYR